MARHDNSFQRSRGPGTERRKGWLGWVLAGRMRPAARAVPRVGVGGVDPIDLALGLLAAGAGGEAREHLGRPYRPPLQVVGAHVGAGQCAGPIRPMCRPGPVRNALLPVSAARLGGERTKTMRRLSHASFPAGTLCLVLLLAACRGAAPPPVTQPEAPPAARATGADASQPMPKDVRWVRDSAEYRASLIQVYRFAGETLQAIAADLEPGTWAVALDADETVIDNSLYQEERAAIGEQYSSESWAEWVARKQAPPLPGAMAFLDRVRELGGKIAIVTNRRHSHCPDTEANFRAYSIPFDVILCKQPGEDRKEARWQSVKDGTAAKNLPPLDVVMWLGDNIRDFPELDQDLKDKPEAALERFGIQYFVFPNPMYGSWDN